MNTRPIDEPIKIVSIDMSKYANIIQMGASFATTIAQDGVSIVQIGLVMGIVGAFSYFLLFFLGLLMGILTSTLSYTAALDIMVVTFEAVLFGVAIVMKETQPRHAEV